MRSISFDNPYLLLLIIPMAAAILIPYYISVSKDNKSRGWVASLIIHIIIIISLSLAAAGLVYTTVKTRTKVYVLADVSYSSNRNLDQIDEYIKQIESSLPQNSMMGIVCFGKDQTILTSAGTEIKSVKDAKVDDSGTDIAAALDYVSTLFSVGEIKRIVLITDGFSTSKDGAVAEAVDRVVAKDIKLDAVYLDNGLKEGESEAQISDVEYTFATYLDHESLLKILIESSVENDIVIDLESKKKGDEEYTKVGTTVLRADVGMNVATMNLPTSESGVFDYRVTISPTLDTSAYNNTYEFTQTVAGKRNILLVTEKNTDVTAIKSIYGDSVSIDSYVLNGRNTKVPCTIEQMVAYDEIILSNVDIRKMDNVNAFIDSVDLAVSQYGKSLITFGDLSIQNHGEDDVLTRLSELLPVNYGNTNKDAKLYTIILDISRSMFDTSQFSTAQDAAITLLSILDDSDSVVLVTLAGEVRIEQTVEKLGAVREELYDKIRSFTPEQGTSMGAALKMAYDYIEPLDYAEKQVMIISDGLDFTASQLKPIDIAGQMYDDGIVVSGVNIIERSSECILPELAKAGGGKYYFVESPEQVSEIVFSEVANDVTESVIEKQTKVNIATYHDDTLKGILSLPDIHGYINSKAKVDATTVLTVTYQKRENKSVEVPLYAYREHGNGRVSSFTSTISGNWIRGWTDAAKTKLFTNIMITNTPKEYVYYPFTINIEHLGDVSSIDIVPSSFNPKAKASIIITYPDGTTEKKDMNRGLNNYYVNVDTPVKGLYGLKIVYTYGNHEYSPDTYFTVPYSKEYDAFAPYGIVNIYDFMRGVGQISEDGRVDLSVNKNEVDTYETSFGIPLFIFSIVLFVADVVIRKFKWKDIKGLFSTRKKEGVAE